MMNPVSVCLSSRNCWDPSGLTGGGLGSVSVCEENHRRGDAGHHVPLVLHAFLLPVLLHPPEPGACPPSHGVPQVSAEPPAAEVRWDLLTGRTGVRIWTMWCSLCPGKDLESSGSQCHLRLWDLFKDPWSSSRSFRSFSNKPIVFSRITILSSRTLWKLSKGCGYFSRTLRTTLRTSTTSSRTLGVPPIFVKYPQGLLLPLQGPVGLPQGPLEPLWWTSLSFLQDLLNTDP